MNVEEKNLAGEYRPTLGRVLWGLLIGALSFLLCLVVGLRGTAFAIETIFERVPNYSDVYGGFAKYSAPSATFFLGTITSLGVSGAVGCWAAYRVVRRELKGAESGAAVPFDEIR